MPLFPHGAVGFDELLELLGLRQGHKVAGDEQLMIEAGGGVFHLGLVLVRAEQQADRWLVVFRHDFGFPVVEVEVHLPSIAVLERADFEINEQVAPQQAVVEDKVVMGSVNSIVLFWRLHARKGISCQY